MAASAPTSESLPQTTPSGPSNALRLSDVSVSTTVTSASLPPGPPRRSSSSSISGPVPPIVAAPGTPPIDANRPPVNRMDMASVLSPGPATQLSMTSKEWVIPPRPKPGRKPATDTPPTKRKAQNRAAQRAFRERRAARVGELEEEVAELKEEHKRKEANLEEKIRHLEVEVETLRARCQWFQSTLEKERLDRVGGLVRAPAMHPQTGDFDALGSSQVPGEPQAAIAPRPPAQPFSISNLISPPETAVGSADLTCGSCPLGGPCACASAVAETAVGCGKCTLDSRCTCLEALEAETTGVSDLKRPLPPGSPSSTFIQPEEKRHRPDPAPTSPMETDFTAIFSQRKRRTFTTQESTAQESSRETITTQSQLRDQALASVEMRDSCGFCSDGSYCVCADTTVAPPPVSSSLPSTTTTTAPAMPATVQQHQTHTPPPSDDDVFPLALPIPMEATATGAIKLPPINRRQPQTTVRSTCAPGGPGTCAQCLADPKSGLFCRSLAANFQRDRGDGDAGGCCGGGSSAAGGCCKQQQAPPSKEPGRGGGQMGLSLSCADAYKTLASHRHFDEAAGEIGEWLPRLKAAPAQVAGRQPIEVEAASIMSVLKGFDVRFGSS